MKDRILSQHFERLSQFLIELGLPRWDSVIYVDGEISEMQPLRRNQLHCFEDYVDRFDEILCQGHGWVNMECLGLLNKTLVISVVEPSQESPSFKSGAQNTSVNISGPSREVQSGGYDLSAFINIVE